MSVFRSYPFGLTYELRQEIRAAVSERRKATLDKPHPRFSCVNCGIRFGDYTDGCPQCYDRRRRTLARQPK